MSQTIDRQRTEDGYSPGDGQLVVNDLTKTFGALTAVDELSFTVQEGEILGVIGPNGAGKSTTFNCITGILRPTAGEIYFDRANISNASSHEIVQAGIGRTFQSFRLLHEKTVIENIEVPLINNQIFTISGLVEEQNQRTLDICERVGLKDKMNDKPKDLTHEESSRLEIGRALATDPSLLLIDEPFAGLALEEVQNLVELVRDVNGDSVTVVIIDHNMRGLLNLVDRAIVIDKGQLIAEGPPDNIVEDEQVKKSYLGS